MQCGDVEVNPGTKGVKLCPQCNSYVVISVKLCSCGFRFNKKGWPCHTKKLNNYSVSTGRPVGTSCVTGFKTLCGWPMGTTHAAGFDVSAGHPQGTTLDNGAKSVLIEDDTCKLNEDIKHMICHSHGTLMLTLVLKWQFDHREKLIGQQYRFDSKTLGIGMCYCCGSILLSRVDNCHTNLVAIDIKDKDIPAVAYQNDK